MDVQVLAVIPDQDTFYDLVDSLEDQGLERITDRIRKSRGVRADIVDDFRRYESALRREDNNDQSQQLDVIENARYHIVPLHRTAHACSTYFIQCYARTISTPFSPNNKYRFV